MVALRENSAKTRKIAGDILLLMGKKMKQLNLLDQFAAMFAGGFAADSTLMKADALVAMAFIVDKFRSDLPYSYFKDINQISLMLLKENNKEIMKAVLEF